GRPAPRPEPAFLRPNRPEPARPRSRRVGPAPLAWGRPHGTVRPPGPPQTRKGPTTPGPRPNLRSKPIHRGWGEAGAPTVASTVVPWLRFVREPVLRTDRVPSTAVRARSEAGRRQDPAPRGR